MSTLRCLLFGLALLCSACTMQPVVYDEERRAQAECEREAAVIGESWGTTKSAVVAAAFERTTLPYASDAWARTQARLDAWAAQWSQVHGQACVEAEVEGRRDEASLAQART